jgi:flagellar basal-body rod modification protein FlgD
MQMLNSPTHSAAAASPADSTSTTATVDPGVDLTNTFLQLLTVQLQNQSPLDPLDPNAFVAQLAQFDSLGELTQIQELMQTLVNDVTPTSGSPVGSSVNSISNPSATSSSH